MKTAHILICATVALAIAGCERRERPRGNEAGNASANQLQPSGGTPAPSGPNAPGPAVTTGPGGLRIDTQALVRECISPADVNRPLSDFTVEQRRALVVCGNRVAAAQANSQMPLRVDPLTTVTSIVAEGTTVIYHVRLDVDAANVPPGAPAQLEANARSNACARPDMRQTMSMGGSYAYIWTDRANRPILQLRIDGC